MADNAWHKKPRKCSDAKGSFPYADDRVPFIAIATTPIDAQGSGMNWANKVEEKVSLIAAAEADETISILTVWPGKHRTDVFIVDDLGEASAVLAAS
ncbi:MAG: hypothetical protein ACRDPE_09365 [Solirubrobacterales bacterium]